MKSELVPHVDKNDTLLGVVERAEAYKKGLIHRGTHGILQNEAGLYLVQQRSFSKTSWPGHYDLSIAETVTPDETYLEALLRGLKEELNIGTVVHSLLKEKYYQEYFWEQYKIFGMICLFHLKSDEQPQFLDGEVEGIQWLSEIEVDALVKDSPEKCTPWFVRDWAFYRESHR